ncbi:hypothetical protein D9619_005808 [Psilocybe cf. subviscida]|uniref:Alpha/beta hydrolase fold-3 domain-containing protein n=1 Tax=Psilocybe cf. subviscida TaxID=2480587 RepID=A0A8H5BWF9_9AGAR|nr:hypothetical protein D9619_005808 [Psilocybe cf. subviscida]
MTPFVYSASYTQDDDDTKHRFDLHPPTASIPQADAPLPLLIFVHGGAWRAEDKSIHAALSARLAAATHCPVAVPNYTLTPPDNTNPAFFHPIHTRDILTCLNFLQGAFARESPIPYDPHRLVLIGHSCSAHMLASIVLNSDATTPELSPDTALRAAVRGLLLTEGIYDLDMLLHRFPEYRSWFIEPAFGDRTEYTDVNAAAYPLRSSYGKATEEGTDVYPSWMVVHSKGDTLVDVAQSESMYTHLKSLYPADEGEKRRIQLFADLEEEHDEVLKADRYVDIVTNFVEDLFPEH